MKIKAYFKSKNPFIPNPSRLRYTKTVDVPDDTDMKWLEQCARDDCDDGYVFDRIEILQPKERDND